MRRQCVESSTCISLQAVCTQKCSAVPLEKVVRDHKDVLILGAVFVYPRIHLDELQRNLKHVFGMDVALSAFCNTVKKMGLTNQRLKHVVLQQSKREQNSWYRCKEF